MTPAVQVDDLVKTFKVPIREGGLRASVRSLFKRDHREVHAVAGVTFSLEPGEIVGFLGPNGAGKTTTLKMLSGLLYPDGGSARVLDHVPSARERAFLKRVALVMGNRTSMAWDLPAVDSFELQRSIYGISRSDFETRKNRFIEVLDLGALITKPVRNLSLGERMKVELCNALLHAPEVLFLDEPTLGLDITMQRRLREFVRTYNEEFGATVLLTSHYMADVTALCERVIVIHHGSLLHDGSLRGLATKYPAARTMTVAADDLSGDLGRYGEVVNVEPGRVTLRVEAAEASSAAARVLADFDVTDLTIEETPIEEVIERVFASGSTESS